MAEATPTSTARHQDAAVIGGPRRSEVHADPGFATDILQGNGRGDILIGNRTGFDTNIQGLNALMAEWGRTDIGYQTRVNHLNGSRAAGRNGSYLLDATTVHGDLATDKLIGGNGRDWFFAEIIDLAKGRKQKKEMITRL